MKTTMWRRPFSRIRNQLDSKYKTIISIAVVALTITTANAAPTPKYQQTINDNLQVLLYVARYRDGDIANQALDAAIHITGKTDPKEEAFAKSLSDKDIHKIIKECERSKLNAKIHKAFQACKPILFLSAGLLILMKFF